jgi:hypothetical protein
MLNKKAIRILRKVQVGILAEPGLYDQELTALAGDTHLTPCCISGWVAWVLDPNPTRYEQRLYSISLGIGYLMKVLDITYEQAERLYYGEPKGYKEAWSKPRTLAGARAGARRIEKFIRSGGSI